MSPVVTGGCSNCSVILQQTLRVQLVCQKYNRQKQTSASVCSSAKWTHAVVKKPVNPCTLRSVSLANTTRFHARGTGRVRQNSQKAEYSGVGYLAEELSPPARHLTSRSAWRLLSLVILRYRELIRCQKNSRKLPCFWWTIRVSANRGDRYVWLVHNKSHPLFCSSSSSSSSSTQFLRSCVVESIFNPALEWWTPPL